MSSDILHTLIAAENGALTLVEPGHTAGRASDANHVVKEIFKVL